MRRSVATDMTSVTALEGRIPMQSHNRRTGQPVHTKSTFVHWSTGSVRLLLVEGAAPSLSTTDVRVPKAAYGRRLSPLPCKQQHRNPTRILADPGGAVQWWRALRPPAARNLDASG